MQHLRRRGITMFAVTAATLLATSSLAFAAVDPPVMPITPSDWPLVLDQSSSTQVITAGVSQQTLNFDTLSGPLAANVLHVDLSNPNVKVGVVLAHNSVYSSDETLTSMAARTGAVAGINGDFFEMGASGRPEGLCVSNGVILQSQSLGNHAVVGITRDGHVVIGPETVVGSVTVQTSYTVPPQSTGNNVNNAVYNGKSNGSGSGNGSGSSNGAASGSNTVPGDSYGSQNPTGQANSFPITAVNRPGREDANHLGLITPNMGSQVYVKHDAAAYLNPVAGQPNTYTVASVKANVTVIPYPMLTSVLIGG
ncbi:MAG: phosphodiester glycosidase family protein, partial [Alicyclobacillus sp.]|nr:phosphodiester glycosidase family protein [Alicyclobacillus sp.]